MRVVNLDTGAVYGITVEEFRTHMRRIDRGFGDQYMVPLQHWRLIAPPIGTDPEPSPPPKPSQREGDGQPRLI